MHSTSKVQAQFLREYKLVVVGGGGKQYSFVQGVHLLTALFRRRQVCLDNPVHSKPLCL